MDYPDSDDDTGKDEQLVAGVRLLDEGQDLEDKAKERIYAGPVDGSRSLDGGNATGGASESSSMITPEMDTTTFPPIYTTVHKKKLGSMAVRNLKGSVAAPVTVCHQFGGAVAPPPIVGSFRNKGDFRYSSTTHRHDYITNRNISTSFDPKTLTCTTCTNPEGHVVLHRVRGGMDIGNQVPPCFVLSDQNFPPVLLWRGTGNV